MQVKIILGEQELRAAIQKMATRQEAIQQNLHRILVSVLVHVGQHKNVTVIDHLFEKLPPMVRANAIRAWFETFGCITFDKNVAKYDGKKKVRIAEAINKPFWKFRAGEGQPYQPMEFNKAIESLVARLKKDTASAAEHGILRDHREKIKALESLKEKKVA